MKRLSSLDALRGVAALTVALVHLPLALGIDRYQTVINVLGRAGVVAFFLLSGYVVSLSLDVDPHLGRFWVRRLFRLFPLYWASIAAAALFGALHWLPDLPYYPGRGMITALINLTMLQRFVQTPDLLAVYWTLSMELSFYFVLSICTIVRLRSRLPFVVLTLIVLLRVSLVVRIIEPLMIYGVLIICLGAVLAYVQHTGRASALTCTAALLSVVMIIITDQPAALGFVIGAVAFMIAVGTRYRSMPRPFLWLGQRSYSLYLTHQLVYAVIPNGLPLLVRVLIAVSGLLLVATATERWIEQPGIAIGRRIARQFGHAERLRLRDAEPVAT